MCDADRGLLLGAVTSCTFNADIDQYDCLNGNGNENVKDNKHERERMRKDQEQK